MFVDKGTGTTGKEGVATREESSMFTSIISSKVNNRLALLLNISVLRAAASLEGRGGGFGSVEVEGKLYNNSSVQEGGGLESQGLAGVTELVEGRVGGGRAKLVAESKTKPAAEESERHN